MIEAGAGAGRLLCTLAQMFPNSRFTLTDITEKPFARARQTIEELGVKNVEIRLLDILQVKLLNAPNANKKHSENADTSTSVTFDLHL